MGVVGLHGEAIIPLDGTYSSIYNIEITNDGSVILGRTAEGKYIAYKVSYDPTPAE